MGVNVSSGMAGGMMKAGGAGGMNLGISGGSDAQELIIAIMKEMSKNGKFIHKSDIYTTISGKVDYNQFERAIERLTDDGAIYSTYEKDVYSLME
jgi:hypothetical protein